MESAKPTGRGLDGVGGDEHDESAGAGGDAAFGQQFAQAFHRAAHALLRRLFARAERLRHLARRLALEVAQQQGVAVRLAQLAQSRVEVRGKLFPASAGFGGKQIIHSSSLLFTGAAAHIGTHGVGREVLRRAMQPAGQDGPLRELSRLRASARNTPCVTSSARGAS